MAVKDDLTFLTAMSHLLVIERVKAELPAIRQYHQRHSFAGLENVVLSQHLGGNTTDNAVKIAQRIARQIISVRNVEKRKKHTLSTVSTLRETRSIGFPRFNKAASS